MMQAMSLVLGAAFFALGAVSASFIGVLVARLHTGKSFLRGRSCCDACAATLAPLFLVPILSYVFLQGRARCCGARISPSAPLAELLLGGLFVLSYLKVGLTPALLGMLLSLSVLLVLVLYDLKHQILPATALFIFILMSAATGFLLAPSLAVFRSALTTAFFIALSLALIHFLSRGRAMGFSDAPFVFGLSLLVGPQSALPGFIFSFWIGAVIGITLLARRPVGSRMGIEVPFAPFLAAGFLLAYFTQWNPFIFAAVSP